MKNTKEFKRNGAPQVVAWSYMSAGNFLVDLRDFFFAWQDRLCFEQVSREYAKTDEFADYHYKKIKENLPQEFQFNLIELLDAHNEMETIAIKLSYQHGFSDGIKFIMQTLTAAS